MKRTLTSLVAVLLAALLVAAATACGSDDSDGGASDATEATSAENTDSAAESTTRTVEHALGSSEVPDRPERVVVVDRRGTLAFLLELGVEPIAALEAEWLFGQPFHPLIAEQAEAAGVEPITATDNGPNVEQVAALDPDLIIGNVRDMGETSEELAQIAPTVGLEWNFADPIANATVIAAVLGLDDEAGALVDEFESALDEAASSTKDPGTVSIVGLFAPEDLRIYREGNLYGAMTTALGGQIVPTADVLPLDPDDGEVNYVSLEQIGLASGDSLISFVNLSTDQQSAYAAIEDEPLVQALPGFQNDRVLETDPQLAFGAAGVTGLTAMLDQLVEFYGA